jgi:uncharacterized protein YPO0396
MSDQPQVSLELLQSTVQRMPEEMGNMRDDQRLLLAMMQRLDATVTGALAEIRAAHSRHDRLARQVEHLSAGRIEHTAELQDQIDAIVRRLEKLEQRGA